MKNKYVNNNIVKSVLIAAQLFVGYKIGYYIGEQIDKRRYKKDNKNY